MGYAVLTFRNVWGSEPIAAENLRFLDFPIRFAGLKSFLVDDAHARRPSKRIKTAAK